MTGGLKDRNNTPLWHLAIPLQATGSAILGFLQKPVWKPSRQDIATI